jgi:hypothetical protein
MSERTPSMTIRSGEHPVLNVFHVSSINQKHKILKGTNKCIWINEYNFITVIIHMFQ